MGVEGVEAVEVRSRLVAVIAAQLGSSREADWIVDHGGVEQARALADRRAAGEPLQYVLGRWPFRSLELHVDRRVLIPRPETEQLVDVALTELAHCCDASEPAGDSIPDPIVVDLGTGSGAIALSLAAEGGAGCPELEVWATDVSVDALAVATANLAQLARDDEAAAARVRLVEGSWFGALPSGLKGRVDLLVSNPPYVTTSEYPGLDQTVRDWEPRGALVAASGSDGVPGMDAIEQILGGAPRWLRPSGSVVIEIAPSLAPASSAAASRAGFGYITTRQDLTGRVRMLVARR